MKLPLHQSMCPSFRFLILMVVATAACLGVPFGSIAEEAPEADGAAVSEPISENAKARLSEKYPDFATGILAEALLDELPAGELLRADDLVITADMLAENMADIPEEQRSTYETYTFYFFERMATEALLKRQVKGDGEAPEDESAWQDLMRAYYEKVVGHIKAPEEQLNAFYNENKEMFGEMTLEDVKDDLQAYLSQGARETAFEEHLLNFGKEHSLRLQASWIAKQSERVKDNPIDKALASGKPVMVDFYADWCGPCQQMKPSVEAIKEQYGEQAIIVMVNVDEDFFLANRHKVSSIPLLLFFNAEGALVTRYEGYMEKEAIEAELKKSGVK